jgi:tetratricopeptide (TPR) repeat protein
LFATNRVSEAVAEMQRARALDPLSSIINTDLAESYLLAHRFDDALSQAQAAVALDPSFPLSHMLLERIYAAKRMFAEAIREAQESMKLVPGDHWAQLRLVHALACAGRKEEARKVLRDLELRFVANGQRTELVLGYAALGDRERMFAELEKVYADHDGGLILLNYEESWDPYRGDPRFQEFVRRVGLPPKN